MDRKIERCVQETSGAVPFSGSIIAARGSEILFKRSYGFASLEHEVCNTPSTKFRIWSITKLFTATAILMLHEAGKLGLDQSAAELLPDDWALDERITVRHLLTHASGLHSYTSSQDFDSKWTKLRLGTEGIKGLIQQYPPLFEPGADRSYNNSAFYLLGLIIAQLSGEGYEQFLKRNIFEPLGMLSTGLEKNSAVIGGMASGYAVEGDALHKSEYLDIENAFAAGGLYSTVEDLFKLDQALYTERLLPSAAIERMLAPDGFGYGLGWKSDYRQGRPVVGHSGSYRGYRGEFDRYPDERVCVIMLSNVDKPIEDLCRAIAEVVLDGERNAITGRLFENESLHNA
ncbi:serine hydrolase [Paenibacillus sp. NEAU-GSW1]|uniref:serine hydrolase domain-containing protein n=1 Tax=Paenibacillus sp. NEAU-GSW1 TaxID=2682486 RepID=UPI001564C757|nr:serine hydrolase domain-containing protein [Paenibacillus sp. NEAU-GSW1]